MKSIPPNIAWPAAIIGLLVLSVGTSLSIVVASRSDGGVQVVENYYQRAVQWDEAAAQQAASDALGWTARVDIRLPENREEYPIIELTVQDQNGQPVTDLQGAIRAFRPQQSQAVAEGTFATDPDHPGMYRLALPVRGSGLWDFEIVASRDTSRFQTVIRKEVLL